MTLIKLYVFCFASRIETPFFVFAVLNFIFAVPSAADGVGDDRGGSGASGVERDRGEGRGGSRRRAQRGGESAPNVIGKEPPEKSTRSLCPNPRLRRGCSEARRSVGAAAVSAELRGPKK